MSIIVDLHEFFVERRTPKKKARGAAAARRLDQRLVIKERLLAKRLIERQRRSTAPADAKDRRGVEQYQRKVFKQCGIAVEGSSRTISVRFAQTRDTPRLSG